MHRTSFNLSTAIEVERGQLYELTREQPLTSPDILEQSQRLDQMINRYNYPKTKMRR